MNGIYFSYATTRVTVLPCILNSLRSSMSVASLAGTATMLELGFRWMQHALSSAHTHAHSALSGQTAQPHRVLLKFYHPYGDANRIAYTTLRLRSDCASRRTPTTASHHIRIISKPDQAESSRTHHTAPSGRWTPPGSISALDPPVARVSTSHV